MISKLLYYTAEGTDAVRNLAVEEYLLNHVLPGTCILYLWQNRNTVVIGRNQDAFSECRVPELEADGGILARRLSGGGAVYHDLGNLNFTFFARKEDYDTAKQTLVIADAVRSQGAEVSVSGRNDLTIGDRKFSGHAYYRSGDRCYHHGTLMIDVDLSLLGRYLNVSPSKLMKHSVRSVRSRVINLKEVIPTLTVQRMKELLIESFGRIYGGTPEMIREEAFDDEMLRAGVAKFGSPEWRYGREEAFTEHASGCFPWGEAELRWTVESGFLKKAALISDGLEADLLSVIPEALEGCPFREADLRAAVQRLPVYHADQRQIADNLLKLLFAPGRKNIC